jgi:hypothetical protein
MIIPKSGAKHSDFSDVLSAVLITRYVLDCNFVLLLLHCSYDFHLTVSGIIHNQSYQINS